MQTAYLPLVMQPQHQRQVFHMQAEQETKNQQFLWELDFAWGGQGKGCTAREVSAPAGSQEGVRTEGS